MRGSSFQSWSTVAVIALLGACSNIIGVSSYDIDPALDEGEGGSNAQEGQTPTGGMYSSAGDSSAFDGGEPSAGHDTGSSGAAPVGNPNSGGTATTAGGAPAAGNPAGGDGTGGDAPSNGCSTPQDCDDTIDCTNDVCREDGTCTHTPDDTACSPGAGNCAICTLGIGCVETPGKVSELLLDPGFDLKSGDWDDYRDGLPASIIADAGAQTAGNSVRLGPTGNNATEQGFADLSQEVTIPKTATALVVSGFYKLSPGKVGDVSRNAADDYTTLTLFSLADENDDYTRYIDYHEWYGDDAAQATWKSFTFTTPKKVLDRVLDETVTLDVVTETWDTRFSFDSLSLKVTTCE